MENEERLTALGEMRQRIMEILAGLSGTEIDPELAYETLAQLHNADRRKFLEVAHQTLTTGTDTGRKMALAAFASKVKVSKNPSFAYGYAEAETARNHLLQSWCCGNVAEAIGHKDADALFRNSGFAIQLMEMYRVPHYNAERTEAYWNGLAALMSIVTPEDDEDTMLDDGGAFILWVGGRSDLADVVRVGRERESIDPETIAAILTGEARVAGSIKDGVL
jgi:hypothetical protein